MGYSTVDKFLAAYPKLNNFGSATIQSYLDDAAAEIDSFLSGVVSLPLSSPYPPLVLKLEKDLAAVGLLRRNLAEASKDAAIERVREDAIAALEEIRDGKRVLVSATGTALTPTAGGGLWSSVEDYTPTFGVGDIEDAKVDTDRTDAEEDARD